MNFWRSVVVKLWFTILLLVSFILLIASVMIIEFFQNYSVSENEKHLTDTAGKIAKIVETHDQEVSLEISWQLIDDLTGVTIVKKQPNEYYTSPNQGEIVKLPVSYFLEDKELVKVIEQQETKRVVTSLPNGDNGTD